MLQEFRRITAAAFVVAAASATPSATSAGDLSAHHSWAAIGVGLSPSPYELDANGSPIGDVAFGKGLRERVSIVGSITHLELFGSTPVRFTNVAIGLRAHLSTQEAIEGGPYLEFAPTISHALYRDRGASGTRVLPGLELAVGTVIPFSTSLALDWRASHVVTRDAGGFSPNSVTHETKRDGLDRGTVRIRLVLRR